MKIPPLPHDLFTSAEHEENALIVSRFERALLLGDPNLRTAERSFRFFLHEVHSA